jgi:hypothetical protein
MYAFILMHPVDTTKINESKSKSMRICSKETNLVDKKNR